MNKEMFYTFLSRVMSDLCIPFTDGDFYSHGYSSMCKLAGKWHNIIKIMFNSTSSIESDPFS